MKKIASVVLYFIILVSSITVVYGEVKPVETNFKVLYNGAEITLKNPTYDKNQTTLHFDNKEIYLQSEYAPKLIDGTPMISAEAFKSIGAKVTFSATNDSATITYNSITIVATKGDEYLKNKSGKDIIWTKSPISIDGVLYVPMLGMRSAFSFDYYWDSVLNRVYLNSKHEYSKGTIIPNDMDISEFDSFNRKLILHQIESKQGPAYSNNVLLDDFGGRPQVRSYLGTGTNGNIYRFDSHITLDVYQGKFITEFYVEEYDKDFKFIGKKSLAKELEVFYGAYDNGKNIYILYSQPNEEKSDTKEVLRLVKYDKNLNKQGQISVYGKDCKIERASLSRLSIVENGNALIAHTSQVINQHQINLSLEFDTQKMEFVKTISSTFVSHSWQQFVRAENNDLVFLDLGDSSPRAAHLQIYKDYFVNGGNETNEVKINVLDIVGAKGNVFTGVLLGGLESSNSNYIISGSSYDQKNMNNPYNIFIATVDKENPNHANFKSITNHKKDDLMGAFENTLTKINDNKFLIMWQERLQSVTTSKDGEINTNEGLIKAKNGTTKYVLIDGSGNMISEIKTLDATVSNCTPIFYNGKIVWYATGSQISNQSSTPRFFEFDYNTGALRKNYDYKRFV